MYGANPKYDFSVSLAKLVSLSGSATSNILCMLRCNRGVINIKVVNFSDIQAPLLAVNPMLIQGSARMHCCALLATITKISRCSFKVYLFFF